MFETSIAGSLPKPAWLAETEKLWPQWRLEGEALEVPSAMRHDLAEGAGGCRHRRRQGRRAVPDAFRPGFWSGSRASTAEEDPDGHP